MQMFLRASLHTFALCAWSPPKLPLWYCPAYCCATFQACEMYDHLRGIFNEYMGCIETGCIAKQLLDAKGLRVTGVHGSDSTATRLGCNSLPTCALRTNIHRRKLVTQLVVSSASEAVAGEQPIVRVGAVTPGFPASEPLVALWNSFKVGAFTSDRTA
jgi:hypothetical protein